MDARLRERRGVLRVSASRHIDCSVRRRPFGPTPFSYPGCESVLWLHVPRGYRADRAHLYKLCALQARPSSPAPRTSVHHVHVPRPAPRDSVCLLRQRLPAASRAPSVFACRVPRSPQPSTSGGKSLILKRVADNRASCGQFPFQGVSKTATRSEMFEKPPLIRSQPTLERWLSTQSSSRPSRNVSKTATHRRVSAQQEIFRAAFAF